MTLRPGLTWGLSGLLSNIQLVDVANLFKGSFKLGRLSLRQLVTNQQVLIVGVVL